MANSQGQAQAALNEVNAKIAGLTSQINALQNKINKSLDGPKANRLSDDQQDQIQDQIDELKNQRGDLQEQASRLAEQANPGASDRKIAERQADRASMKQGWGDEVAASEKATKTGPPESRSKTVFSDTTIQQETTVSGGGTTVTKSAPPTPAQEKYYSEYKAAQDADIAANDAQREEYLRSKGLDSATPAQKRAAIREARANGELPPEKEPGTDFKAANPNPPPGMPSTTTVNAPLDNGTVSETTVEKQGAANETAAGAIAEQNRSPIVNTNAGLSETDAGTDVSADSTAEPLSESEKQNLRNSQTTTGTSQAVVTPTTTASGNQITTTSTGHSATQTSELKNAGDVFRAAQNVDKMEIGNTNKDPAKSTPITITPNPLHEYATYTYSISLHLLTKEAYNALGAGKEWLPKAITLIGGGGRYSKDKANLSGFRRSPHFDDDFYFDGLNLDTVIGMSQQTRGANAIDIGFTIVEPYGLTLINRLLAVSYDIKQPNYLTNPYVIQIDFFGNNDAGDVMHPLTDAQGRSLTKYIPIKIGEMKIKVGTNGSTYTCRAFPYNHQVFSQNYASTPANFEVSASTVGDFFTNTSDDSSLQKQVDEKNQQREDLKVKNNNPFSFGEQVTKEKAALENSIKSAFKAKSYTGAYNAYQEYMKNSGHINVPLVLKFNIDPEIASSKIVIPESNSANTTTMVDNKDNTEVKQANAANKKSKAGGAASAGLKTDSSKFNINAGDNILDIINKVMRNSTYITDQLKDKKVDKDGNPLRWFKIIPKFELTDFDSKRNDWGAILTYHIIPYAYQNNKHPAVSISSEDEIRKNLRKKYAYIYSGQNDDIIDFSIDFDTLFVTPINVLTENSNRTNASADAAEKPIDPVADGTDNQIPAQKTGEVTPSQTFPISGDLSAQSGLNVTNNPAAQRAADVMKSIYAGARGDMLNVKLKIIGDPDFIKTDDVYYNPGNSNYPSNEETHTADGSIRTDQGDIFCLLYWRTPSDLDQETGLPDFTRFQDSVFDGVFKIMRVSSDFKGGKFEQNIDMYRFRTDSTDKIVSEAITQRSEGGTDVSKLQDTLNNKPTVIERQTAAAEASESSRSNVDAQRRINNNSTNADPNARDHDKTANVVTNGETKTAEQDAVDNNNNQDGTTPNTSEPQPKQAQSDGGPPVANDPGTKPQSQNPPAIDNNNLPAGVTQDPDTGLYIYRGRRFSANDSADLAAKTKAIDDGTTISTTKTDAESGTKKQVDFNGSSPTPKSTDSNVAALQDEYSAAQQASATAQRRLDNANNGMFDDDPKKKQYVIDNNTKLLNDANAKLIAIEAQLKDKGAAPR